MFSVFLPLLPILYLVEVLHGTVYIIEEEIRFLSDSTVIWLMNYRIFSDSSHASVSSFSESMLLLCVRPHGRHLFYTSNILRWVIFLPAFDPSNKQHTLYRFCRELARNKFFSRNILRSFIRSNEPKVLGIP